MAWQKASAANVWGRCEGSTSRRRGTGRGGGVRRGESNTCHVGLPRPCSAIASARTTIITAAVAAVVTEMIGCSRADPPTIEAGTSTIPHKSTSGGGTGSPGGLPRAAWQVCSQMAAQAHMAPTCNRHTLAIQLARARPPKKRVHNCATSRLEMAGTDQSGTVAPNGCGAGRPRWTAALISRERTRGIGGPGGPEPKA
eukprot:scaffold574_cov92-Isochrysis_galbana.AAC.9